MPRRLSAIAPDWWDYTTLDREIIDEAARLTPRDLLRLSRPGFRVVFYDTLEEFYLAEALEYIEAWRQSTDDNPVGICGPIGPTEQLPLVARIVNALELDVRSGHFWGMDEWFDVETGREVAGDASAELRAGRSRAVFQPDPPRAADARRASAFPEGRHGAVPRSLGAGVRCAVMQGGQGDVKHWAFNDPLRDAGRYKDQPPAPRSIASSRRASSTCTR